MIQIYHYLFGSFLFIKYALKYIYSKMLSVMTILEV